MNMMLGDIVEAVFKGLLKEAGVEYGDSDIKALTLSDGTEINGTYDLVIDEAVDDVSLRLTGLIVISLTPTIPSLVVDGLAILDSLLAMLKQQANAGGWWVVNKANGKFKYISATGIDIDKEVAHIEETEEGRFKRV